MCKVQITLSVWNDEDVLRKRVELSEWYFRGVDFEDLAADALEMIGEEVSNALKESE